MKQLEYLVIERVTNLNREQIGKIYGGDTSEDFGVNIILILAIISFVIHTVPVIIEWWRNRKALARVNVYFIVRKQLIKEGNKDISAIKLSNAIYDVITSRPELVEEYNNA
jgi:hypothetical protein